MKKLLIFLFPLCLCFSLAAFPKTANSNQEKKISSCQGKVRFSADYLYWKAFQGNLDYADTYDSLSGGLGRAKANQLSFDFHSGFRIGGGYTHWEKPWDVGFNYTYYHTHAKDSASGNLFPSLNYFGSIQGGAAALVTQADAEWHLRLQYVDFEFGRLPCWGGKFSLFPHLGVRGAWINQGGQVTYQGGVGIPTGQSLNVNFKNDFWGWGLNTRLDARYPLNSHLFFVSNLAASLLWGHFDVKQVQTQLGVQSINLKEEFNRLSPTVELALGLAWEQIIRAACPLRFVFSAMAEGQYWWQQNRLEHFPSSLAPTHVPEDQDLALFGLTLRMNVYF